MANNGKIGVISDLHSNLEAMKVVLKYFQDEDIDSIICLGDIVGYNANPVEVTYLTHSRCKVSIKGNHDRYVLGFKPKGVREEKLKVIDWTRDQLTPQYIKWIGSLEDFTVYEDLFLLTHGSPRDPDEYIVTNETIKGSFKKMNEDYPGLPVCFFGHSHFPMVIGDGKVESKFQESKTIKLNRDKTYLINPGSLGQPRDKCPKTSFGVFDTKRWSFSVVRLDYDFESTGKTIVSAGLDRGLAHRLTRGR
ncbi:MAG: metallophosphoesterase family protein [Planctomycetota bacterium]|nr:metallophosphoesterase family protein [Planctomycetota bacterium]